ncbi:hypothetical protein [Burkholderia ambifaria]|jgi:hypothetical protein|uniref:hypothetical protein n=1 Tax=Burkholderia ambifaria TaxID=152480 RepID=UPI0015890C1D|nr:hypothetical protein [Burkholderia ambifaria]
MSGTPKIEYNLRDQHDVERFVNSVAGAEGSSGMVLDSVSAANSALEAIKSTSGVNAPRAVERVLQDMDDKQEKEVIKSIFDGVNMYRSEHGFAPSGDIILSALHQARTVLDSVSTTNAHHDQISLNPAAPMIAIISALAEACPFAGYLAADSGSNEARLIIIEHQAGSDWGDYSAGDSLDGINSGGEYLGAPREAELVAPNDDADYKFEFTERPGAGDPIKLLRGRTNIYVNGLWAAEENRNANGSAATSPLSGHVTFDGVEYAISGVVRPGTGEVVVTPTPAFPKGTNVTAEVFIDYEVSRGKTPRMAIQGSKFSLYAAPYRGIFQVTPEARSQFTNEVGVDAGAEAMLAVRAQFSNERHYAAIRKVRMVGRHNISSEFDFNFAGQSVQKTRAVMWQDFASHLGMQSQIMAEKTSDHGITHLYVGKDIASQFQTLPDTLFQSSGITERPGIYRVGRLFNKYEVYYTPKGVSEDHAAGTGEIVAVGRSSQTSRCPIIFGDAQAPFFEPLGTTVDLESGYGFTSRCFTHLNPHQQSALGCAVINVKNLQLKA